MRVISLMKLGVALVVLCASLLAVPAAQAVGGVAPSWCTGRTNSYCTYTWDWMNRCCNPSYIAPGAYCPSICE